VIIGVGVGPESLPLSGHGCRDPEHFFAPFHSFYLTVESTTGFKLSIQMQHDSYGALGVLLNTCIFIYFVKHTILLLPIKQWNFILFMSSVATCTSLTAGGHVVASDSCLSPISTRLFHI